MELQTIDASISPNTDPRRGGGGISVAIDGPAGAGKSTLAKRVADALGYLYIDTGAMYRAATWVALEQKIDIANHDLVTRLVANADIQLAAPDEKSQGKVRVFVNGSDVSFIVRSRIITKFVSPISAIGGVRTILADKQKKIGANGSVVMDGRDIGTVVLPHAEVKVFLTASPEVRAKRRLKDMQQMGQTADLQTIIEDIKTRDHIDSTREIAPLKQAEDAVLIDTDNHSIDQVVETVLELCRQKLAARREQ
ncbi:MAG: (d)CMP kinase [Candidatus Obscuribacterales bacterium]|nr:(d)CMP kinase [Candidatus Obscuribacterales bacterium]